MLLPETIYYTTITDEEGKRLGFDDVDLGEFDRIEDLRVFEDTIKELGIEPHRLFYGEILVRQLITIRPELVWNLNSGILGSCREAQVPSVCEMLGIPLVGSGAWTAFITQDKTLTANWIRESQVPISIPDGLVITNKDQINTLGALVFPNDYIVKPNNEDSSRGIDAGSVLSTIHDVSRKSENLLDEWGAVRVEKFIPGFDISANLACDCNGNLIPLRPVMIQSDVGIYTGEMKTCFDDYPGKNRSSLFEYNKTLAEMIMGLALMIGKSLKFRHYARIDMRYDVKSGIVYFLEANICPSFEPDDDYVYGSKLTGISFEELIKNILLSAWDDARAMRHKFDTPKRIRNVLFS